VPRRPCVEKYTQILHVGRCTEKKIIVFHIDQANGKTCSGYLTVPNRRK
jgi:hypothetical protein